MGVDNIAPTEPPRRPPEDDLRTRRAERKGRVRPAGHRNEDRWEGGETRKQSPRTNEEPPTERDEEAAADAGEADPQPPPEGRKGRQFDRRA